MKINSDLVNAENTYNHSTTHTYSCEYMNELGMSIHLFGQIAGSGYDNTEVTLWAKMQCTKLGTNNVWRVDIDGQLSVTKHSSDNYRWGIRPDLISNLFYQKWGKHLVDDGITQRDTWHIDLNGDNTDTPTIKNINLVYGYGTSFNLEPLNGITYLVPARIYTTNDNSGGWAPNHFANTHHFTATIYLREVD